MKVLWEPPPTPVDLGPSRWSYSGHLGPDEPETNGASSPDWAIRYPYHPCSPVETPLGPVRTLGEAMLICLILMNREGTPWSKDSHESAE